MLKKTICRRYNISFTDSHNCRYFIHKFVFQFQQNHAFRLSQQQSNGMRSHNTIDITNDGLDDLAYIDDGATSAPPTPRGAMCDQLVKLRGPFSPLERDIRSVMNSGLVKTVKVAAESVNSVILETNPQVI